MLLEKPRDFFYNFSKKKKPSGDIECRSCTKVIVDKKKEVKRMPFLSHGSITSAAYLQKRVEVTMKINKKNIVDIAQLWQYL